MRDTPQAETSFAAFAIYNSLVQYAKSHRVQIRVEILGLAASAASIVAMAGDRIIIPENGSIMIHNSIDKSL